MSSSAASTWPGVAGSARPNAFVAARVVSALLLLGHQVAHVLYRNEGWYYLMYLNHWTSILATISECSLLVLALMSLCNFAEPHAWLNLQMALWHLVQPFSMIVAILYWTSWSFQHPASDVKLLHYLDLYTHGLNCLQLLVSFFFSRLPFSMRSGWGWTVGYSLLFTAWTGIHFHAKLGTAQPCADYQIQECPIYRQFDWHKPQLAIIILMVECSVACPVVCAVYSRLARCRDGPRCESEKELDISRRV